jgi:S-adenosylmethionine:tRNA ribosyltransferase-isomerase
MHPTIAMRDFAYHLPDEQIARYPLAQRDASRLLHWRAGQVAHRQFADLPDLLAGDELMFFNDTKVIPARMHFQKPTGARIELFLLSPVEPSVVDVAMQQTATCTWECTIGHLKSWKNDQPLERTLDLASGSHTLRAHLLDRQRMHVRLEWTGGVPLLAILDAAGQMPIPPYLRRAADAADATTYQTVYSRRDGAVAAPTAGLHFTPEVLARLDGRGIRREQLTLHVSAGTFQPVKTDNALDHDMHFEQVVVGRQHLEALLTGRPVVAVGTTSLRTLESLYWYGVRLLADREADFLVKKTDAYELPQHVPLAAALHAVADRMDRVGASELHGTTQLYVMPGYRMRVCDKLVTNFHQPGSTLLLLVAAFTGGEAWRSIYDAALAEGYRFLSYGDSSLLERG